MNNQTDSHYSVCHLEDCNNAEANARLIAAAPELPEALRAVTDLEASTREKGLLDVSAVRLQAVYDRCRAAIQKATGGR